MSEELRDHIQARKAAEEALRESHDLLELRIAERTAELKASKEELERELIIRRQTEEALRESQERYRLLAEHTGDVILTFDPGTLRITYASPSVERSSGFTPMEFLELSTEKHMTPDSYQRLMEIVTEEFILERSGTADPDRSRQVELEIYNKNGQTYWTEVNLSYLRNDEGKIISIIGTSRNIDERKKAEELLRAGEEKYRTLLDNVEEGYFECDLAGNLTFFNNAFIEIMGYSRERLSRINFREYMTAEEAERIYKVYNHIYRTGEPVRKVEHEIIDSGGNVRVHQFSTLLMRNKSGQPIGFRGVVGDITEKKRAEDALRESEERFRLMVRNALVGILVTQDGGIVYANPEIERATQYSFDELLGRSFLEFIHPEERDMVFDLYKRRFENKPIPRYFEGRFIRRDGREGWYKISSVLIEWNNRPALQVFLSDITEIKRAAEELRNALREKETLLQEVHHRIKNNLQIIVSLLGLQSRRIKDKKVQEVFQESKNRVMALSLVHEVLYKSSSLEAISLDKYIFRLARSLASAYDAPRRGISLNVQADEIKLQFDYAVPCGLIINELITNALKYAFPQDRSGEIRVVARSIGEDEVEIVISDNGIGLPEGYDWKRSGTLGLPLMAEIAEIQLHGCIQLDGGNGLTVTIRFKQTGYSRRV
ncbi:MAG: PAS domain S-box protein [Thermodesulfobacteriota bacterium]